MGTINDCVDQFPIVEQSLRWSTCRWGSFSVAHVLTWLLSISRLVAGVSVSCAEAAHLAVARNGVGVGVPICPSKAFSTPTFSPKYNLLKILRPLDGIIVWGPKLTVTVPLFNFVFPLHIIIILRFLPKLLIITNVKLSLIWLSCHFVLQLSLCWSILWDRISLCSPDWPGTYDAPASDSCMLWSQAFAATRLGSCS